MFSLAAQSLIDALAVGAYRRAGLCLFGYGEGLATQGNDVLAVDCGVEDLVLFDVVEELRGITIRGGGVFADIWAFDGLSRRTHGTHNAP